MRIRTFLTALLVGAACAVPIATGAAHASTTAIPARHCVGRADTGETTCHATFREAVAVATGGRITDAPPAAAAAMRSRAFEDRVNSILTAGAADPVDREHDRPPSRSHEPGGGSDPTDE